MQLLLKIAATLIVLLVALPPIVSQLFAAFNIPLWMVCVAGGVILLCILGFFMFLEEGEI